MNLIEQKKIQLECQTDGSGWWTDHRASVHGHLSIKRKSSYAKARFYWKTGDWYIPKFGLIYTDSGFLSSLRKQLTKHGFNLTSHIDYSEQGMQGDDYVDLDTSLAFADEAEQLGFQVL